MKIERINHLVLTVKDIDETCNFYRDLFGMEVEEFSPRKKVLKFGFQMLTLHQKRRGFSMEEQQAAPGPIDICFTITDTVESVQTELESKKIPTEGMVERRGAAGKVTSIYFRDPDQNLIEVSVLG
jgi:catechol 2,3-dioxygenase-like lactoylglutathione lyase family enzyme